MTDRETVQEKLEYEVFSEQCAKQAREEELTTRELEVLKLLACGYSNKRIMQELVIELSTLKQHLANIYLKIKLSKNDDKYLNNSYATMRVQAALFYWLNFNNGKV